MYFCVLFFVLRMDRFEFELKNALKVASCLTSVAAEASTGCCCRLQVEADVELQLQQHRIRSPLLCCRGAAQAQLLQHY